MNIVRSILMLVAGLLVLTGQSLFADQLVLEATDDSWVNGNNPAKDTNYGTDTRGVLRYQNATWGFNYALYKFDTSALPANIEVNSVRMRFYTSLSWLNGTPTNFAPIAIFNNTQDWSETNVTFNTAPTYDATATDTLDYFGASWGEKDYFTGTNVINSGGWLEYQSAGTVALVQGWADGTIDNFGISMMGTGSYVSDGRTFQPQSKEYANPVVHPEIIVNYTVIPTSTVVVEASDDSWVNGNNPYTVTNYGSRTTAVLRYQNTSWGKNLSLFKFDLSSLPENIEVTDVSMRFYSRLASWPAEGTNFAPVAIFKNTEDWDELSVVFTNAPTYAATAAEELDHFGTTNAPVYFTGTNTITADTTGWLEFQGTGTVALVQGWVNGSIDNFGISMWGTGDFLSNGRTIRPYTKEYASIPALRPELMIKYVATTNSGYEGWAGIWGVDIGAETNDYDEDGLNNLYEYGLGGDPTNALDQGTSPESAIVNDGGTNWFGYVHPQLAVSENSGLSYYLELNTDLVHGIWTNVGYFVLGTNVTGGELDFVTNVTDTTDDEKFIRLIIK